MTALPRAPRQIRNPVLGPRTCGVVNRYARRNALLEPSDIEQEAALAALEADRTWRTDGGTSRELWQAWLVGLALSRFVAEQRVPVSLPKRKGEPWHEAASAGRVPLMVDVHPTRSGDKSIAHDHPAVAAVAASQWRPIEDRLDDARAMVEVRRLLDAESEAAKAVLLAEERPAVVAERMRLSRAEVYQQTASAVRRLRAAFVGWEVAT
jgi:hypothetical protein